MPRRSRFSPNFPLYTQIAERLTAQIQAGEFAPGVRLPSERDLAEQLGVNRMTLRHALDVLEVEGLLYSRRGAGTFVAEPKIERHAAQLGSVYCFDEKARAYSGRKGTLLECRAADAATARELGLETGAPTYYVRRLRLLNAEPVLLESFALSAERFPRFDQHNLGKRSVYEILEKEYGVKITRARESLEPVVAGDYEAKHLRIAKGAPLMLETRVALDAKGQPIEAGHDLYRGDRFRFVTEIAPLELL